MKKKLPIALLILGVVIAAIGYGFKTRHAASIGIIGGADGPTVMFVAGQTGLIFYAGILLAILATAFIVYLMIKKRKK